MITKRTYYLGMRRNVVVWLRCEWITNFPAIFNLTFLPAQNRLGLYLILMSFSCMHWLTCSHFLSTFISCNIDAAANVGTNQPDKHHWVEDELMREPHCVLHMYMYSPCTYTRSPEDYAKLENFDNIIYVSFSRRFLYILSKFLWSPVVCNETISYQYENGW